MAVDQDYIPLATSPATADAQEGDHVEDFDRSRQHRKSKSRILSLLRRPKTILAILGGIVILGILHSIRIHIEYRYHNVGTELPDLHPGDNPYFHTGDVWAHNDLISAKMDKCSSLGLLRNTSLPMAANEKLSHEEENELIAQGCGTNETTIIILASLWFAEAFAGTSTAGETIYAQSVISALNANGYSYVFSSLGWYNSDMRKSTELWHQHRWNTRLVMADPEQIDLCYNDKEQKCLKTDENEDGIEGWRLLSFWYWDDPRNPLGEQFTLSPSPRNNNYFLSYSIEPTCRRLPYLTPALRAHPPHAYLLAKQMTYLADTPRFSWTLPALKDLESDLGIKVIGGIKDDEEGTSEAFKAAGLENLGRLGKMEFYEQLAMSFVLIGVGQPRISPSPWDALCMGVPFINPILAWDEENPTNRSSWHPQQWHMAEIDPPYVYSVFAHDLEGMRDAVKAALDTPIESWIPDYMKFDFVSNKMAEVVERDWQEVAANVMEGRGTGMTR